MPRKSQFQDILDKITPAYVMGYFKNSNENKGVYPKSLAYEIHCDLVPVEDRDSLNVGWKILEKQEKAVENRTRKILEMLEKQGVIRSQGSRQYKRYHIYTEAEKQEHREAQEARDRASRLADLLETYGVETDTRGCRILIDASDLAPIVEAWIGSMECKG